MKEKFLVLIMCLFLFSACGETGDDEIQPQQPQAVKDTLPTLEGQFIFLAEEAVLKGENFIYGIALDSMSRDLAKKVEPYKTEKFDMVPVSVKARIIENPGQFGWDEFIEIQEVLKISDQQ